MKIRMEVMVTAMREAYVEVDDNFVLTPESAMELYRGSDPVVRWITPNEKERPSQVSIYIEDEFDDRGQYTLLHDKILLS